MLSRAMTVHDVPEVLALWGSCDGVGLSEGDNPSGLTAFLARNPYMSWVSVSDARVVGAVLAGHDGRRGFLYHLAVHADFRRRGVARALVEHILTSFRSVGILKCHVMVFRGNEEGHRFWEHVGWRRRDDIDVHTLII